MVYTVLVFFLLSLLGTIPAAPAQGESTKTLTAFNDVAASDPNVVYIKYIVARGLIAGFPDGGYHPTEALTRAQAAALLARTVGLDTKGAGSSGFKDVPSSHWAAGSITAASRAGYIKGMSADTFQPDTKLTRAQGISLFMRLSKQADTGVALPALSDFNNQHWAARPAATALDAGMIGLSADKKNFYPDAEFSRGDLSRMLGMLLTSDPDLSRSKMTTTLVVKKGEVKVLSAGKSEAQAASASTSINPGDSVITGESGEAEINLPDGSGLLLKSNTNLTLKNNQGRNYIKKDGSAGVRVEALEVELKQGRIFGALASRHGLESKLSYLKEESAYLVASLATHFALAATDKEAPWYKTAEKKKVKVKVDMPWGVCGIRGSFWSNQVSATENSSSLLTGEAEVNAAGQSQPLAPGQATTITAAGQAPTTAAAMSADEQKAWDQEKAWVDQKNSLIEQNQETIPNAPPPVAPPKTPDVAPTGTVAVSFKYAVWENYVNLGNPGDVLLLENFQGMSTGLDVTKLVFKDDKGHAITLKGKYAYILNDKPKLTIDREKWTYTMQQSSLEPGQYANVDHDPEDRPPYYGNSNIPGINANHRCLRIMLTAEDTNALRAMAGEQSGYAFQGTLDAAAGWMIDTNTRKAAPALTGIKLWSTHMGGKG